MNPLLSDIPPRRNSVVLVRIIQGHRDWRIGAEVGLEQGRTSLAIMRKCPSIKLYAVDPFQYIEDSESSGLYKDWDFGKNEQYVRAVESAFPGRMTVMKMTSVEAAAQITDGALDFVFIDANHMYAEVLQDIDAWTPKVRRGGWVMGHDYSHPWPGVVCAVNERFGKPMQFDNGVWAVERS